MREKIGQLDCLVRRGENEKRCFVLLHGFGADAADLFPLADYLDPQGEWSFYVPNAPLEVPIGPGWTGRGWFPISLRDLEAGVDFTQVRPPGLDKSSEMVSQLIFDLNAEQLVLGGFSQGAMIATEVAMNSPNDVAGLVLYSAVLLDEPGWTKKASGLAGKKLLQSHGSADTVLPFSAGQRLFNLLKGAGMDGQFIGFSGAHEIPVPVLRKTAEFISNI
ncbi:MAG: alpha/beta fold hydrolase [Bdellovibrionales bacterium]|nr:alpha/beta fold hydrolase [Bdellovibrionales bacterium]